MPSPTKAATGKKRRSKKIQLLKNSDRAVAKWRGLFYGLAKTIFLEKFQTANEHEWTRN
jgi:hypothetical protein